MKKIIFILFFFVGLSQANSYILENTDYNNNAVSHCYYAKNNINSIIACIDTQSNRYITTYNYNGILIDSDDLGIYGSVNTTSAYRVYETDKFLMLMRNTTDWSTQYLHYYYRTTYAIINKNTGLIEVVHNACPYYGESSNCYYIGSQYDGNRIKIFFNSGIGTNLISLYNSTYTVGTGTITGYYLTQDRKTQLYNNYTVFTNGGTGTYLREGVSDGIYNFFAIAGTGSLNYLYKDGTLATLGGASGLDGDGLRYTRVFTGSIIDYDLILNQTFYNTGILNNEINDNYEILQNNFINESGSGNIIKNDFYTPLIWASGSTTYFINSTDNKLYKEGKISINFSGSELTGTGWEFGTGSNTSGINLNFNCDTDNSGDIGIGEGLYCPIIYIRGIFDLFASGFTTMYQFFVKLVELSPN